MQAAACRSGAAGASSASARVQTPSTGDVITQVRDRTGARSTLSDCNAASGRHEQCTTSPRAMWAKRRIDRE